MQEIKSLASVSSVTTAQVNTEVDTALSDIHLNHLLALDGATSKYPEQAVADSIIAKMIAKGDPATPSTYDCTTDSLEAISDKITALNNVSTAQVATEADSALSDLALDHLMSLDGATQKYPEQVAADSTIAKIIAKGDPATPSSYDCTTDSLEALSDKLGAFSGDGGANADDSAKALLDIINTAVGTTLDGIVDNILLDTQIRVVASGTKAITNAQTKWLSIDSGTNGAEILSIVINGLVGAVWTLDVYVPAADAVADTAAGDKRSSISYAADGTTGGLISPFAIPFNCFLDFTNGGVAEASITQVQIVYRSRGTLTLAWEA